MYVWVVFWFFVVDYYYFVWLYFVGEDVGDGGVLVFIDVCGVFEYVD